MPGPKVNADSGSASLPVDKETLDVLSKLKSGLTPEGQLECTSTLLTRVEGSGPKKDKAVEYCLKRLVLGVSVSSGASRGNMSVALAGLTRSLGTKGAQTAVTAVANVYGQNGSFVTDYTGADRERALGAVHAITVVSRAVGDKESGAVQLSVARDLVATLCVAASSKWGLGESCALAARDLLLVLAKDDRPTLVKALLAWCRERSKHVDGAALALLLLVDVKAITTEQFYEVYPKPAVLQEALGDCFETTFSLWRRDAQSRIPIQWDLALQLAASGAARKSIGGVGIGSFWNSFCLPVLCKQPYGREKSTLPFLLFPRAIQACNNLEELNIVLSEDFGRLWNAAVSGRGRSSRKKNHLAPAQRYHEEGEDLADIVAKAFRDIQRNGLKVVGSFVASFVLWVIRCRLASKVFRGNTFQSFHALLSDKESDTLLRDVVAVFAQPNCHHRDVGPIRASAVQVLVGLSSVRPKLLADIAKMLCLYTVFSCVSEVDVSSVDGMKLSQGSKGTKQGKTSALCIRALKRSVSKDATAVLVPLHTFGGIAPAPAPEISAESQHRMFRQVLQMCSQASEGGRSSNSASRAEARSSPCIGDEVIDFIGGVVEESEERCVSVRCEDIELKASLDAVQNSVASFKGKADSPILLCVRRVLRHMTLCMYDPSQMDEDADFSSTRKSCAKVSKLLHECLSALEEEDSSSSGSSSGKAENVGESSDSSGSTDEDRKPTALEQAVFVVAEICRQHSTTMRSIAVSCFESLAEVADGSVSAVLFDLLESDDVDGLGKDPSDDAAESDDESMDLEVDMTVGPGSEKHGAVKPTGASRKALADESGDAEDEDGPDDDIMLDDEDPEMLQKFDEHLAQHMKLVKVEKKKNKRKRQLASRRSLGATRILDLVEVLARHLRLRLETMEPETSGDVVLSTFVDLTVRFLEFAYGPDAQGVLHAARLSSIFSKHLDRPLTSLGDGMLTEEIATEYLARCFDTLREADMGRSLKPVERKVVAHVLTLVSHASPRTEAVRDLLNKGYMDLWELFTAPKSRFLGVTVFESAASRGCGPLLKLGEAALKTAVDDGKTSGTRTLALDTLYVYGGILRGRSGDENGEISTQFWAGVQGLLVSAVKASGDNNNVLWKHGRNLRELLRLVDSGVQTTSFPEPENAGLLVSQIISNLTLPRPVRKSCRKLLNSIYAISPAGDSVKDAELPTTNDIGEPTKMDSVVHADTGSPPGKKRPGVAAASAKKNKKKRKN